MNGGWNSRNPVDGQGDDSEKTFFRHRKENDALSKVGHGVEKGNEDVPKQNPVRTRIIELKQLVFFGKENIFQTESIRLIY